MTNTTRYFRWIAALLLLGAFALGWTVQAIWKNKEIKRIQAFHNRQLSAISSVTDSLRQRESQLLLRDSLLNQWESDLEAFFGQAGSPRQSDPLSALIQRYRIRIREINQLKDLNRRVQLREADLLDSLHCAEDQFSAAMAFLSLQGDSLALLTDQVGAAKTTQSFLADSLLRLKRYASSLEKSYDVIEWKELGNGGPKKLYYIGEKKDGKPHGFGVGLWENGSTYVGHWMDGLRHGQGVHTWKDGERYSGEFVQGKRHGQGSYKWLTGEVYNGGWLNNMRHGYGAITDKKGKITFEGEWAADKLQRNKSHYAD